MSVAIVCMINHTHFEIEDIVNNNSQYSGQETETSVCFNTPSNSSGVIFPISNIKIKSLHEIIPLMI